jgi:hypothetical protein
VFSLHRSQIAENSNYKEYVIDAVSGSRIRRLGGPISLLFLDKFLNSGYRFFYFGNRLLNGREALFKSSPGSNERVASGRVPFLPLWDKAPA